MVLWDVDHAMLHGNEVGPTTVLTFPTVNFMETQIRPALATVLKCRTTNIVKIQMWVRAFLHLQPLTHITQHVVHATSL